MKPMMWYKSPRIAKEQGKDVLNVVGFRTKNIKHFM